MVTKKQNTSKIPRNKKDAWKYNKDGFFNLKGYLKKCNSYWEFIDWLVIINAPRNMGKSYGTWEYIENDIWIKSNFTKRIAYCRTNAEKMKHARENFNAKYRGKYYMNESKIYKQSFDEKGKEILSARVEIGAAVTLNQAENYKSGFFENYELFFWDEYNEIANNKGQYAKFIDLLKTIKRKTTPFHILLVGNKVNETNDILHNLEVDFSLIEDKNKDYLLEIENGVYFIEIGNETFKFHNPNTDLVNRLASYNDETNAYLNEGAYLTKTSDNLIIYSKYVEPTKHVRSYFALGEYRYEFGDFEKDGEIHSYFHLVHDVPIGWFAYSLSILGDMRNTNAQLLAKDDLLLIANDLKNKAKNKKLWFCEYDTKLDLELFIRTNCDYY